MKPEVSQNTKALDRELGSIQNAVLDAMAPLTAIVETDAKGDNVSHKQAVNAAKATIELVGNANARINHLRRTKIITQMNKARRKMMRTLLTLLHPSLDQPLPKN